MVRLTVIIPAFKEYENLKTLIPEIHNSLNGELHEIIVVDDNSQDGTKEMSARLTKVITRTEERGLSSAVIRGIQECKTGAFVVMDADHQHPPSTLSSMAKALQDHQLVVGSRYVPNGGTSGWTLKRRIVSKIASLLGKPLCGINDSSSGFFGTYKSLLEVDKLNPIGFKIGLDIYSKLRRHPKTEVPYIFLTRKYGDSKFTFKQVREYLKQLLKMYIELFNPKQWLKFCTVGASGTVINLSILITLTEGAGLHYVISAVIAIGVAMTSNFIWNKFWTFKT